MKKIAVMFLCAAVPVCGLFGAPAAPATDAADGVQALERKVAELQKLLEDSEKAMYDIISKDMQVISRLRAENAELKARVVELSAGAPNAPQTGEAPAVAARKPLPPMTEEEAAQITMRRRQQQNAAAAGAAVSTYKTPAEQYQSLLVEKKKVKELSDKVNADIDKANAETKKELERQSEEKEKSFWDSAFPF